MFFSWVHWYPDTGRNHLRWRLFFLHWDWLISSLTRRQRGGLPASGWIEFHFSPHRIHQLQFLYSFWISSDEQSQTINEKIKLVQSSAPFTVSHKTPPRQASYPLNMKVNRLQKNICVTGFTFRIAEEKNVLFLTNGSQSLRQTFLIHLRPPETLCWFWRLRADFKEPDNAGQPCDWIETQP